MATTAGFLNKFKSEVGDLARAYLFYVNVVSSGGASIPANHKFLVKSASLPTTTIEPIPVPFQGLEYKMGSVVTVGEWECTFNADVGMKLRKGFIDWMNLVHNAKTNEHGSPTDYYGQIDIQMLDPFTSYETDPAPKYITHLFNAWPSTVGTLELGYDSKEIASFSVTFQYNWHEEETSE